MLFELLQLYLLFFIIKELQIVKQMISKNELKKSINNDIIDNNFFNNFTNNFQSIFKNIENDLFKENRSTKLRHSEELID